MGMDMNHALILAGGLGQRLWPISRKQSATKEGVDIHSQTMLELTISRVSQWVPRQRIWVVSSRSIETYGCRLIKEPFRKNTAAAIAWGLAQILHTDKEAFVGIFPVDHLISPWEQVTAALEKAKEQELLRLSVSSNPRKKPQSSTVTSRWRKAWNWAKWWTLQRNLPVLKSI